MKVQLPILDVFLTRSKAIQLKHYSLSTVLCCNLSISLKLEPAKHHATRVAVLLHLS